MGVDLSDVDDILDAFEDEDDAEAERARMENVLSILCHACIVYPDTQGLSSGSFEWLALNVSFIARWFRARGDRFVYDPMLRMAFVTPLNPSKRRIGNLHLKKDEMLVGCALRANFEQGLREGDENRVKTNIAQIQTIFRSVLGADGPSTPTGKRIDQILSRFKACQCVRVADGPLSEEREVTIMPGITALFSDEFIKQIREIPIEETDQDQPEQAAVEDEQREEEASDV